MADDSNQAQKHVVFPPICSEDVQLRDRFALSEFVLMGGYKVDDGCSYIHT